MKYRFKLGKFCQYNTGMALELFENEWLSISETGWITVCRGYAWNGCSPYITILDLFHIGTPNGIIDYRTGKPITYYASCVHDALCQFSPVSRRIADRIFLTMLEEVGFKLAKPYYWAVRLNAILRGIK